MRRFVLVTHDVPTSPDFSLDDLPGTGGRIDVACRCLATSLLTSHGIREDAEVVIVIDDAIVIRAMGSSIRNLRPDERSTGARLREAIADGADAVGAIAVTSSPGITVERNDLDGVLAAADGPIVQLHEDGDPINAHPSTTPITFVLSDHREFSAADERVLASHRDARISLGPVALHAEQAITIAHHYLDTDGYSAV